MRGPAIRPGPSSIRSAPRSTHATNLPGHPLDNRPTLLHVHVGEERLALLTRCSRGSDIRWHRTSQGGTGRHVEERFVPGRSNLRIRCPKGRGGSNPPSRTPSDLRIFVQDGSEEVAEHAFLLTPAHSAGPGASADRPITDGEAGRRLARPVEPSAEVAGDPWQLFALSVRRNGEGRSLAVTPFVLGLR